MKTGGDTRSGQEKTAYGAIMDVYTGTIPGFQSLVTHVGKANSNSLAYTGTIPGFLIAGNARRQGKFLSLQVPIVKPLVVH